MRFSKLREFDNDFVVIDAVTQQVCFSPAMIQRMAHRKKWIGFTQLILIEPPYVPDLDFYCRIFDIEGNEVKYSVEGRFAIAQFIYQQHLSAKKTLRIGTANGNFVITFTKTPQIQIEFAPPLFEIERSLFRATNPNKNYIIHNDGYTLLCGVAYLNAIYCLVFDWQTLASELSKVEQMLQQHERFSQPPRVCFVETLPQGLRLQFSQLLTEESSICHYVGGIVVAAAHALYYGDYLNRVNVSINEETMAIQWQVGSPVIKLEGYAKWLFDGVLPY